MLTWKYPKQCLPLNATCAMNTGPLVFLLWSISNLNCFSSGDVCLFDPGNHTSPEGALHLLGSSGSGPRASAGLQDQRCMIRGVVTMAAEKEIQKWFFVVFLFFC